LFFSLALYSSREGSCGAFCRVVILAHVNLKTMVNTCFVVNCKSNYKSQLKKAEALGNSPETSKTGDVKNPNYVSTYKAPKVGLNFVIIT
jgi:hypothetical protein